MSSGVKVEDKCVETFNLVKTRKAKWVTYKLSDSSDMIVHDSTGPAELSKEESTPARQQQLYEQFCASLPSNPPQCRYAAFNFVWDAGAQEGVREKVLLLLWAPDSANIKQKMLITSSKGALVKALAHGFTEVEAHDQSDLAFDGMRDKAARGK